MRQVPHYLLIGNGRVARHFQHYFSLLGLSFAGWHRNQSLTHLQSELNKATHVLLLINDQAIDSFITEHLESYPGVIIHCSGSLNTNLAFGAHPLMTFSADGFYSLEQYQSIPFILDHDAPDFSELLPGLSNLHTRLEKSLKAKYHALCVLSGNFSCLLWQKLFSSFQQELNIPADIAHPYLLQQMRNILQQPQTAFTGPLARRDYETIQKNLIALEKDPFQQVYQSFVTCFEQLQKGETL